MPDQVTAANSHAVLIAQIADLRAQLAEARQVLGHIANWRKEARLFDKDMGHRQREFSDTEDWRNLEEYAASHMPEGV